MRTPIRLVLCLSLATVGAVAGRPAGATDSAPSREGSWPLLPRPAIARGFDPPAVRWGAGHRGVDLRGNAGQPVRSALAGTVTFAAPLAGRGVVVVDHGGLRTTYESVGAGVGVGDRVPRGGVIGTLQRSGSHCYPAACLHWGLRRGEVYLNPLTLVGAGPVRLLPLTGGLSGGNRRSTRPSSTGERAHVAPPSPTAPARSLTPPSTTRAV